MISKLYYLCLLLILPASLGAERFIDNGNGTISDTLSGLLWWKCSNGQTYDAGCKGELKKVKFHEAMQICESSRLGGRDWRVPGVDELLGLLDYSREVAIDKAIFSVEYGDYLSSTDLKKDGFSPKTVYVEKGTTDLLLNLSYTRNLLCVSSPTTLTDAGEGTVLDRTKNILWTKCSLGQDYRGICVGSHVLMAEHGDAVAACASLRLRGKRWRLPKREELLSLAERIVQERTVFQTIPGLYHWSNSKKLGDEFYMVNIATEELTLRDGTWFSTYGAIKCVTDP